MKLDATHGSLEVRIEAPHNFAHARGERGRATHTDEHSAATTSVERGTDEDVEVFEKLGAARGEGYSWREVHAIKRFGRRTGVEY